MTPAPSPTEDAAWSWDPSLYSGSAPYYAAGRIAYPPGLADALVDATSLDRTERLLDLGCGPGSLTLLLAPHVVEAIGLDADPGMLAEAARLAARDGIDNVTWMHLRAEELPADLAPVDFVTFAQSFHWMDRPRVASAVRTLLRPGGVLMHVHAALPDAERSDAEPPGSGRSDAQPSPPRGELKALVERYLGPTRRAGKGVLPHGTPAGEDVVYRQAGFTKTQRLELPGRWVGRSVDDIVASVFSMSSSTPHLFGTEVDAFEADLRDLLVSAAGDDGFSEWASGVALDLWR